MPTRIQNAKNLERNYLNTRGLGSGFRFGVDPRASSIYNYPHHTYDSIGDTIPEQAVDKCWGSGKDIGRAKEPFNHDWAHGLLDTSFVLALLFLLLQLQTLALGAVFHCNLTVVTTSLRSRLLVSRMPTCIYRGKVTQKNR